MLQPHGQVMNLPQDPLPAATTARRPEIIEITVVAAEATDHGFEAFYRHHRGRIAKALSFALGDVDLAAEATDEAFVRAYERWPKVQRLDRPDAWVYRVATNWATSVLRRR